MKKASHFSRGGFNSIQYSNAEVDLEIVQGSIHVDRITGGVPPSYTLYMHIIITKGF